MGITGVWPRGASGGHIYTHVARALVYATSPSRSKLPGAYPPLVIQSMYAINNPERINPTTIMSLAMSFLSMVWQFLVRFFLGGGGGAQSEPGIAMSNI